MPKRKENKFQKNAMKHNPFNLINEANPRGIRKIAACPKDKAQVQKATMKCNHTQTSKRQKRRNNAQIKKTTAQQKQNKLQKTVMKHNHTQTSKRQKEVPRGE